MAAPTAAYVLLPDDTSNAGKKVRTRSRVVGSDTVHEHIFNLVSIRDITGIYTIHSAVLSAQASAHDGTTTAHWWLFNPVGNATFFAIRRLMVSISNSAATAAPTSPRTALQRFTFTGTPSGAAITAGKHDSNYGTFGGSLRTAVTGATVTLAQIIRGCLLPAAMTAVGSYGFNYEWKFDDDDEFLRLAAGEGVALIQKDAGTASDPRRLTSDIEVMEYN